MRLNDHDVLGKYRVIEAIGRGAMGTVYLGHDPFHDRYVALKVAHASRKGDQRSAALYRSLFFNEMRAAGMLAHPNIVEVFDVGVEAGTYFIAMEYVEGGRTLDDWCGGGQQLALERVAEVVLECAQALDHAHRKGVIHRDVKPSNVLVASDGAVKLADFSVALLTDLHVAETQLLDPVGSPVYMSPEQLRDEPLTQRSDLFSLGNVLYELLTGHLPFAANTLAAVTHKVLNERPAAISTWRNDVPPSLERIVAKALARDPAARYATALEMAADLAMAFSGLHDPVAGRAVEGRVDALRGLEFFADFRDAEIWELLRWAHWEEHAQGAVIVAEAADDDALYVLVDGEVAVSKANRHVRALGPGECFGEIGFLSEARRSATVRAVTAISVLRLNAEILARASLQCQVQFQRVFIRTLLERLVHTTEDLVRRA